MPDASDVLIIGGGVIGLTTAYFLARQGVAVAVVDRGDFGMEASWAGAGILPPGKLSPTLPPYEQLRALSADLLPKLSAELKEKTGIDNGYLRSGGLDFFDDEEQDAGQEWRGTGIEFEEVSGADLRRFEPALAANPARAFFVPGMAQLRNPRHLQALLAGCQRLGVRLQPFCTVDGFDRIGQQVRGIRSSQGYLAAGRFVIAAGSWSRALLAALGIEPAIYPVRGQIALLNTGVPLLQRILLQGKRYLVPRSDGRVLVGSTEEDVGFDKRTTAAGIGELLQFAIALVPELASARVEQTWAGLRPGSRDGLPYLGAVPSLANVFVAAGHFRAGIHLSAASALVLQELLLGQTPTVPLAAFRVDR